MRLASYVLLILLPVLPLAAGEPLPAPDPVRPGAKAFQPGTRWLDDKGRHISAHGGGILFHQGSYYLYGEARPEKGDPEQRRGVHVYISKDLSSWKDGGIAFAKSPDKDAPVQNAHILERPKVVWNATTRKFVMWFHHELVHDYESGQSGVAVATSPVGPFTFVSSRRRNAKTFPLNLPEGMKAAMLAATSQAERTAISK